MDTHRIYRGIGIAAACTTAVVTGMVAGTVLVFAVAYEQMRREHANRRERSRIVPWR